MGKPAWNRINILGRVFGSWVVLRHDNNSSWICRCICGNERSVNSMNLVRGRSTSCGIGRCARTFVHGHSPKNNNKRTAEYDAWNNMKARCYRSTARQYMDYGGRGIKVCERWIDSFANFLSDMGLKPAPEYTLERKDVNGDYGPDNCVWETWAVQAMNKRVRRGRYSK